MAYWLSSKDARKYLDISGTTLKNWKDTGKIRVKVFSSKKIMYDVESVNLDKNNKRVLVYLRIWNKGNKDEFLKKETFAMKEYLISHGIIVDDLFYDLVDSLEDRKEGFEKLVQAILEEDVKVVYLFSKENISFQGFDVFETFCKRLSVDIEILDKSISLLDEDEQIDLLKNINTNLKEYKPYFSGKFKEDYQEICKKIEEIVEA